MPAKPDFNFTHHDEPDDVVSELGHRLAAYGFQFAEVEHPDPDRSDEWCYNLVVAPLDDAMRDRVSAVEASAVAAEALARMEAMDAVCKAAVEWLRLRVELSLDEYNESPEARESRISLSAATRRYKQLLAKRPAS